MAHVASTSRDPVCGRDVDVAGSTLSTIYRGLVFHFCSAQCLERFQGNPRLYTGALRSADSSIPKRRTLRLAAGDNADIARACRQIGEMTGIVSIRAENGCLAIEYDIRQANLAQIEAVATGAGLRFKGGGHGWRRWLWKFMERNELDNLAHAGTGACCNQPPAPGR